jgi:hypothetical protein
MGIVKRGMGRVGRKRRRRGKMGCKAQTLNPKSSHPNSLTQTPKPNP